MLDRLKSFQLLCVYGDVLASGQYVPNALCQCVIESHGWLRSLRQPARSAPRILSGGPKKTLFASRNDMMQSLCETCRNRREVRTIRSRFLLCELSLADDAYPKYPPQPVVRCDGYHPRDVATESRQGDPPGLPT